MLESVEAHLVVENIEIVRAQRSSLLQATFDLRISGLGVIRECRLVRRSKDGEFTVYGPSVKAETGGYPKFVIFEPEVADRIAALARAKFESAING